jgi:uncharacterized protein YjaZ
LDNGCNTFYIAYRAWHTWASEYLSFPAFFSEYSGYACGYHRNMVAQSYHTINSW